MALAKNNPPLAGAPFATHPVKVGLRLQVAAIRHRFSLYVYVIDTNPKQLCMAKKLVHLNKIVFATVIFVLLSGGLLYAQEKKSGLTWYTDINQACKLSNKTKKPVFALFTGSDWCVWCHKLEADVFAKATFQAWAKKNVILLILDFPRQTKLPDTLAKQNSSLQQFFKVSGFPTVWIFNIVKEKATGQFNITALGSLGYPQAEPGKEDRAFLATANGIMKTKKTNPK
jgi:thioredoxin-related protein